MDVLEKAPRWKSLENEILRKFFPLQGFKLPEEWLHQNKVKNNKISVYF